MFCTLGQRTKLRHKWTKWQQLDMTSAASSLINLRHCARCGEGQIRRSG